MKQGEFEEVNSSESGFSRGEAGGLVPVFLQWRVGSGPAAKPPLTNILAPLKNALVSHDSGLSISSPSEASAVSARYRTRPVSEMQEEPRITESKTEAKAETEIGKMTAADRESERRTSAS